jgi:hypothetical protein
MSAGCLDHPAGGITLAFLGTLAGMDTALANQNRPPRILEISWGCMKVEGLGSGKDFKLYPGGGRAWDWTETGTRHSPGIHPQTSRNCWPAERLPWCSPRA